MAKRTEAKAVTIGDVAAAARVSRATVSRVVNGLSTVDPAIAERVRSVIAELNYRPSETARNLSLGRTHTVAVVVPDLDNPTFQAVLRGVTRAAALDGYRVLVGDAQGNPELERATALEARSRCDALVLCAPRMGDAALAEVLARTSPVAVINRDRGDLGVPEVSMDYAQATELLIDHLVTLGHKRILYLGGPDAVASNRARERALQEGRDRHDGVVIETLIAGSTLDSGWSSARAVLESGASAVIAFNDLVALGLLSHLRELAVHVPKRLSVVGIDDIPFARFSDPPLTTVAVPQEDLGSRAWHGLRRVIFGDPSSPAVRLTGVLQVRESSGFPTIEG
ncbi:LacI family DNA-binding transcriptional regulator [Microbacterium sp. SSM24]|uniref:LacI family DNA-binding transcriptional regulator n=1 Tax=Microbacterium sp. SSM24 TaxID=2991714 RepID=UPI00222615A9|nr:LacI family DNA-binding transcriptional regulator [Microbacterium sp. SSM24]MCW3492586.1 LacI family transcriptional regulator [Microbacterium sp. SSM24]